MSLRSDPSFLCSVYPTIDPRGHYANQTFAGKVVLVTGASRGIGREIALQYARAGASVVLVGRQESTLAETREIILAEVPGAVNKVLVKPADVKDWEVAEDIVKDAVGTFGRLDILVPNAGALTKLDKGPRCYYRHVFGFETEQFREGLKDKDPVDWWNTFEVNIRGVFNFVR